MVLTDRAAPSAKAESKAKKQRKKKKASAKAVSPAGEDGSAEPKEFVEGGGEKTAAQDPSAMLGAAVWLMLSSPGHKHLFVADFEWLVVPAILAKQFRLYRRDNVPIGFVSWARVSEEVEMRIINGSVKLSPKEWTGGDRLWIIDVIAPFGGVEDIMADLNKAFEGQTVKYIQADENGRRVEVLK
jgi:cytolysin-activating lysine-acyltransferase